MGDFHGTFERLVRDLKADSQVQNPDESDISAVLGRH
jgi:hypothetical protein